MKIQIVLQCAAIRGVVRHGCGDHRAGSVVLGECLVISLVCMRGSGDLFECIWAGVKSPNVCSIVSMVGLVHLTPFIWDIIIML